MCWVTNLGTNVLILEAAAFFSVVAAFCATYGSECVENDLCNDEVSDARWALLSNRIQACSVKQQRYICCLTGALLFVVVL